MFECLRIKIKNRLIRITEFKIINIKIIVFNLVIKTPTNPPPSTVRLNPKGIPIFKKINEKINRNAIGLCKLNVLDILKPFLE